MPKIHIKLETSKQFCLLLMTVVLASLNIIFLLKLAIIYKLFIVLSTLAYAGIIAHQFVFLRAKRALVNLISIESNELKLIDLKGKIIQARLRGDSTVSRWVSILRFDIPGERFAKTCIIFRDAIPANDYRQLLVYLKIIASTIQKP